MIRQVQLEDEQAVYTLVQQLESYTLDPSHFHGVYQTIVQDENQYGFVYIHENQIVGFISFYILNFLHHNHKTSEIVELVVDEKYRNLHIGEALIQHVEALSKNLGLEEIELSTSLWRKDAHRFYKRNGFDNNHYTFVKKI